MSKRKILNVASIQKVDSKKMKKNWNQQRSEVQHLDNEDEQEEAKEAESKTLEGKYKEVAETACWTVSKNSG